VIQYARRFDVRTRAEWPVDLAWRPGDDDVDRRSGQLKIGGELVIRETAEASNVLAFSSWTVRAYSYIRRSLARRVRGLLLVCKTCIYIYIYIRTNNVIVPSGLSIRWDSSSPSDREWAYRVSKIQYLLNTYASIMPHVVVCAWAIRLAAEKVDELTAQRTAGAAWPGRHSDGFRRLGSLSVYDERVSDG